MLKLKDKKIKILLVDLFLVILVFYLMFRKSGINDYERIEWNDELFFK